jgi:hypothetical protein
MADGDASGARREFESAAQLWNEIGAPFENALARMGVGDAYRAQGNEQHALLEFQAAQSVFEQIGAKVEAARAARASSDPRTTNAGQRGVGVQPAPPRAARSSAEDFFQREGDVWSVTFEGHTVRLRDRKGLHYLARLLAHPGREFHVLDLVLGDRVAPGQASRAAEPELWVSSELGAGPLLDVQAKESYRRRLVEIEEDIEDARAMGDSERADQADTERDVILRELSRAIGLGNRDRHAGSSSERARASVTRAVRQAMARIHEHNSQLGKHFDRSIRTGTYCAYLPDPRASVTWKV